jgi:hypothetical protein
MLINSKQMIPEVYARERDMQVFTSLIDLLLTANKYDIDTWYKIYDAKLCPEDFLPELGITLNYKYDNANTVISNRQIIDVFMLMLRHKGCEIGLKMAAALSLTSMDLSSEGIEMEDVTTDYVSALAALKITVDHEKATITIDYPNVYTQVRYLLDYVRPVGMLIKLRSIANELLASSGGVLAQLINTVTPYKVEKSMVNTATVNFSYPITQEILDKWEEEFTDSEIDFNN